ncbi:SH3 domain-containing protein [Sorangium sp. So ce1097]|uniref:SH3 domain-containing protein n=1 Tax=Sorangium sp. So ce1097 TaxID=3133330 RepID=UPI003F5F8FA0
MAKADMAKRQRPLTVDIPRPGDEQPVWSRVGVIALVGFVVGVAWPRLAGVRVGPSVPGDPKPTAESAAASAAPAAAAAAPGTAEPEAKPPEAAKNQQQVVVGPGRITRCSDKKSKKIEDCGELQFDPIALPRLRELAQCPAALGVDGKLPIGFELNFEKKEVQVVKGKKTTLPASTVSGILQCAAREFSNVSLEEVPRKYRRYSLVYTATFIPPGAQAEAAKTEVGSEDQEKAAGTTTSEAAASGLATVSWDTALVRGAPKEGDVVMRLVRGTRVKLVGRQNDWYKIEHRGKTGWVYRGSIGL